MKHEVVGVVGEGVAIPCNCTPGYAHTGDRPALILWYKDKAKLPIYRSVCFIITIHFVNSQFRGQTVILSLSVCILFLYPALVIFHLVGGFQV